MKYNIKYDLNVVNINDSKVILPSDKKGFKKFVHNNFNYCSNTFVIYNNKHNVNFIYRVIKELYRGEKLKGYISYSDDDIIISVFKKGFYCYTDNIIENDVIKSVQNII